MNKEEDVVNEKMCVICQENIKTDICSLPCSHVFHNDCIVNWFRSGQIKCPVCNDPGPLASVLGNEYNNHLWGRRSRISSFHYKYLEKESRKKTASAKLKKNIESIKNKKQRMNNLIKEKKFFLKNTHPSLTAKEIVKKHNNYQTRIRNAKWKISRMKSELSEKINMIPVIIPIKDK